jgi:hypothetical protein
VLRAAARLAPRHRWPLPGVGPRNDFRLEIRQDVLQRGDGPAPRAAVTVTKGKNSDLDDVLDSAKDPSFA